MLIYFLLLLLLCSLLLIILLQFFNFETYCFISNILLNVSVCERDTTKKTTERIHLKVQNEPFTRIHSNSCKYLTQK